jgi:hypothetical protein
MNNQHWFNRHRFASHLRIAGAVTLLSAAAAMAFVAVNPSGNLLSGKSKAKVENKFAAKSARANALTSRFRTLLGNPNEKDGEAGPMNDAAQAMYDDQAYPAQYILPAQQQNALNAANAIKRLPGGKQSNWQEVGPSGVPADALVASESTGASSGTIFSGRATAIAVAPNCTANKGCAIFIGAAGGGVWQANNALDPQPNWAPSSNGIPSNAIGSLAFDPNDPNSKTLYAGTGEPNGSSDSEAGVGLYKSIDGGKNWTLIAGSTAGNAPCADGSGNNCPVATGRSIGAIAIDPANANHIFIGTDVARHGSSSVNGGRFTPPGSAKVGLYESTDGGATFSPAVILDQDVVDPNNPTGGDLFRAGCSHIELYRPASETQVYASFFDYGIFRRSNTQDSDNAFHQIFASAGAGTVANSGASRTEFSLAPNGSNLRIYVGDAPAPASFWRVNNANVVAATLYTGGTNGGWTRLSSSANGTPGFASFNYCSTQCTYDMPVFSPPGSPSIVYIGSSMQYGELGGRSNGRAIQRSEDAGVNFTDMTIDTNGVSLHPDQHAIASTPFNPNIAFIANDGGIWRLNGSFSNVSSQCASRGLTGNNLIDCTHWLSKVPTTISTMNRGLGTLQFQSLAVNVQNPLNDIMGGLQDNGTQAFNGSGNGSWFVTIFGDGGQSGINIGNPNVRMHTFFNQRGASQIDVTFRGTTPTLNSELGWNWVGDPGSLSGENMSFYIPLITDPRVSGTWFFGAQHVWRTQDNAGDQTFLEENCSEFVNGLQFTGACGDWVAIGADLTSTSFGTDKTPGLNGYVVALGRGASDTGMLWAGLRRGRVFVASNGDNADNTAVTFYRIDETGCPASCTNLRPTRFVSGIAVDPSDPNHAFISYSGYNAYATASSTATGHVFEVTYDPVTHTATWTNIDHNLGDEPVTGIALDAQTGDLFISTDFGVNMLKSGGSTWIPAAGSLPPVAVYGLTIDSNARVLYAATHGRGAWKLSLQ